MESASTSLRQRLVRQRHPVAQDVRSHVEHVLGQDVAAAAQQGQGPAGGDQAEAGSGRAP